MYYLLVTLFTILAAFDASFTVKQLKKFGIDIELNPIIRFLSRKIGIETGVPLGVGLPAVGLAIGGWYVPSVLYVGLVIRTALFLFQLRQLKNGK